MKLTRVISCLLLAALCLSLCCCAPESTSLTAEYSRSSAIPVYDFYSEEEITPENYANFAEAYMNFAANMLISASEDESAVLSPLSLYTALMMTANGASGKTLRELEKMLGEDETLSDLNTYIHYLNSRVQSLNGEEGFVNTANSLWINDEFSVKAQYLQSIVNYFDAEIFRTELAASGAEEINEWIEEKTSGEIEDMLSSLSDDTAMVLVNALLFDDEWAIPYEESDVFEGTFNGAKGEETATYMQSNEMLLESSDAKGIIKSYKNTPCKFVAILPNEGVSLEEYVSSLSGAKLTKLFSSLSGTNRCVANIPQFELRTNSELTEAVKSMGAELMFTDEANFDSLTMTDGLSVSGVLQESFIEVNADGTKAGSATTVTSPGAASGESEFEVLNFDRPFLFIIVENEYNLPLFIGTVGSID